MKNSKKKLGIVQTRGLGDLVIALPIAGHYRDQDYEVYWPILEQFLPSMQAMAPWVHWIPVPQDPQGQFFYHVPLQRLTNLGVKEVVPLYQSLSNHPEFTGQLFFQHTKFDQHKYLQAGVPFLDKWRLDRYITRNTERELDLYNKLVTNPDYVVIHLEGSDHTADFDRSIIPQDWQQIVITDQTDVIGDWLMILEKAQSLILVDSVYSNLVDQLGLGEDLYFLPRSHIQLTPTLGRNWTWIENTNLNKQRTHIFQST